MLTFVQLFNLNSTSRIIVLEIKVSTKESRSNWKSRKVFSIRFRTITSSNKPVKPNMFDVGLIVGVYSDGFMLIIFVKETIVRSWGERERERESQPQERKISREKDRGCLVPRPNLVPLIELSLIMIPRASERALARRKNR